ncbi:Reverse transcriptase Ty1/copia-type domain-containing protein [Mycena venus]|uniref:Reverse transcriptase Ty1/copia-type domain-containing protein n=1 Tax=Mycena venus TaxID=2733690 RepID=A0A8H7DAZ9_9AGAR|nr:Reverse transcriptase Ty1/copia-type domain-containing protein [Mycena venus]
MEPPASGNPSAQNTKHSPLPSVFRYPPSDPSSSSATLSSASSPAPEPCRSTRERAPSRYAQDIAHGAGNVDNLARNRGRLPPGMCAAVVEEHTAEASPDDGIEYALVADVSEAEGIEPRNLAEARRSPDWPQWEKATKDKLAMLEGNGTWEIVDASPGANVVGNKWVFA